MWCSISVNNYPLYSYFFKIIFNFTRRAKVGNKCITKSILLLYKTTTHVSVYCSLNLIIIITFANKNNFPFSVVDSSIIAHNLYPKYNAVHYQCNVPGGGVYFPPFLTRHNCLIKC